MKEIYKNYRGRTGQDVNIAGFVEITKRATKGDMASLAELAYNLNTAHNTKVHIIYGRTGTTSSGYEEGAAIAVFGNIQAKGAGFVCPEPNPNVSKAHITRFRRDIAPQRISPLITYEELDGGKLANPNYRCVLFVQTVTGGKNFNYGVAHNRLLQAVEGQVFMKQIPAMMKLANLHVLGGDFNQIAEDLVDKDDLAIVSDKYPYGRTVTPTNKYLSFPVDTNSAHASIWRRLGDFKIIFPSVVSKHDRDHPPQSNMQNNLETIFPIGTSITGNLIDYHIVRETDDFKYDFKSQCTLWRNKGFRTGPTFVETPETEKHQEIAPNPALNLQTI